MKVFAKTLFGVAIFTGLMNTAAAYVGPGAGLSLLGALWGLLAAVFAALVFVVLWPLRRIIKSRREKATPTDAHSQTRPSNPSGATESGTAATAEIHTPAKSRAQQA
jgi:membrane protein implicated in regulation of membrane protease activity